MRERDEHAGPRVQLLQPRLQHVRSAEGLAETARQKAAGLARAWSPHDSNGVTCGHPPGDPCRQFESADLDVTDVGLDRITDRPRGWLVGRCIEVLDANGWSCWRVLSQVPRMSDVGGMRATGVLHIVARSWPGRGDVSLSHGGEGEHRWK